MEKRRNIVVAMWLGCWLAGSARANCVDDAYHALMQVNEGELGPHYKFGAYPHARDIDQIKEFRLGAFNLENFLETPRPHDPDPAHGALMDVMPPIHKDPAKVKELGETVLREKPDVLFTEENGKLGTLRVFSKTALNDEYRPIVITGNDSGGRNIGALVRKDFPVDIEIQSYKNLITEDNGNAHTVFSRDLPVLLFRKAGAPENADPFMILIGTHFKSQRDSGGDVRSVAKRTEQAIQAAAVIRKLEERYPGAPIAMGGDFNSDLRSAPEFTALKSDDMADSFNLSPHPIPVDERTTQTYFPRGAPMVKTQMDAILLNKRGQDLNLVTDAKIVPYLDANGDPKPLPTSFQEREKNPSDHFMVTSIWNFETLWKAYQAAHP